MDIIQMQWQSLIMVTSAFEVRCQTKTQGTMQRARVPATHMRTEAIAEEVEEELGPHVTPDQRKQVAHRIAMRIDKSTYPPDPELFEPYEKYAPGSAKALIDKYLEGIDHDRARRSPGRGSPGQGCRYPERLRNS